MMNRAPALILMSLLLLVFGAGVVMGSIHGTYAGYPVARVEVDGQRVESDVPAIVVDGRTMVPLRAISEAFGADVTWDQSTYTVGIYDKTEPPEESATPAYSIIRVTYNLEGCIEAGYYDDSDLAAGAEAGHPGIPRCIIPIHTEPRLNASVAWNARAGDSVYLVDKHDFKHWAPEYGVPGAYVFWEVENMQTGERGWLVRYWVLAKGECDYVQGLIDRGIISPDNIMSYEEKYEDQL